VGAQGAWSLTSPPGTKELLSWSYGITLEHLARAERDAYIAPAASSAAVELHGVEQRISEEICITKTLLAKTKALSTNLLYYRGYVVAANMGRHLRPRRARARGQGGAFEKRPSTATFWMEDRGYYAYFEDENAPRRRAWRNG